MCYSHRRPIFILSSYSPSVLNVSVNASLTQTIQERVFGPAGRQTFWLPSMPPSHSSKQYTLLTACHCSVASRRRTAFAEVGNKVETCKQQKKALIEFFFLLMWKCHSVEITFQHSCIQATFVAAIVHDSQQLLLFLHDLLSFAWAARSC